MMMCNVREVQWDNYAEALPSFLIILGIPLTYSIGDGLALGLIAYPVIKLSAGQGREVNCLAYVLAAIMAGYFIFIRASVG